MKKEFGVRICPVCNNYVPSYEKCCPKCGMICGENTKQTRFMKTLEEEELEQSFKEKLWQARMDEVYKLAMSEYEDKDDEYDSYPNWRRCTEWEFPYSHIDYIISDLLDMKASGNKGITFLRDILDTFDILFHPRIIEESLLNLTSFDKSVLMFHNRYKSRTRKRILLQEKWCERNGYLILHGFEKDSEYILPKTSEAYIKLWNNGLENTDDCYMFKISERIPAIKRLGVIKNYDVEVSKIWQQLKEVN